MQRTMLRMDRRTENEQEGGIKDSFMVSNWKSGELTSQGAGMEVFDR